jgi:ankyrin repeat protein
MKVFVAHVVSLYMMAVLVVPSLVIGATEQELNDLWNAIRNNKIEKVQALIEADPALVNAYLDNGRTPVIQAVYSGTQKNKEVTQLAHYLVKKGADVNGAATGQGIGKAAKPEDWEKGETALMFAIRTDAAMPWIDFLLAQPNLEVDKTNAEGDTALLLALKVSNNKKPSLKVFQVVDALLKKGASIDHVNNNGENAFLIAIKAYPFFTVSWPKEHKKYKKEWSSEQQAFAEKLHFGSDEILQRIYVAWRVLLEQLSSQFTKHINHQNAHGETPLLRSAMKMKDHYGLNQDGTLVKLLIEKGARIDHKDMEGNTALMRASYYGNAAIVKALLKAGAAVNIQNKEGNTALMEAAKGSFQKSSLKSLIQAGEEPEYEGVVELLLSYKGNLDLKNKHGRTALEIAKEGKNKDVYKLLQEAQDKKAASRNQKTSKKMA